MTGPKCGKGDVGARQGEGGCFRYKKMIVRPAEEGVSAMNMSGMRGHQDGLGRDARIVNDAKDHVSLGGLRLRKK